PPRLDVAFTPATSLAGGGSTCPLWRSSAARLSDSSRRSIAGQLLTGSGRKRNGGCRARNGAQRTIKAGKRFGSCRLHARASAPAVVAQGAAGAPRSPHRFALAARPSLPAQGPPPQRGKHQIVSHARPIGLEAHPNSIRLPRTGEWHVTVLPGESMNARINVRRTAPSAPSRRPVAARRAIFAAALLLLGATLGTPVHAETTTLRIGHFPNITHIQALVAHGLSRSGQGWFEQRLGPDVNVEWFVYNAGPSAMEAIFADSIDLTYVGPSPAINAYAKARGDDIRIIAGAAEGGAALVV